MEIPKILIVDDEDEARGMLGAYLMRNLECEVSETRDGRDALERIDKEPLDLILLDIKMPGISGLDVLERAKELHPDTGVIIISGYDSPQVVKDAFQKGASEYIPKPSSREVVLDKVVEILKKKNKYIPKRPS